MADPSDLVKGALPAWAKEPARRALRAYGSLTSALRPLPDYLIIGTKRGGTTSLWKGLRAHPQVVSMFPAAENLKSPHFFDIHFERGEAWYRSYFPTERARTRLLGDGVTKTVVGDASPYYMFHPLAAHRVAETLPQVKLVVLLRDPVERAYSHYNERRREGTEPLSFSAALAAEAQRLAGEERKIIERRGYYSRPHDFCSYLARGRYLEHLEPWLRLFPRDQLLIMRSEDFYAQPLAALSRVFAFLGLPPGPPGLQASHLNRLPSSDVEPATRAWLRDYFRPHIEALEDRLDTHFHWDG